MPACSKPLDWEGCATAAAFLDGEVGVGYHLVEDFEADHREKCKQCREFEPAVCPAGICDGSGWENCDCGDNCRIIVPCPACLPR